MSQQAPFGVLRAVVRFARFVPSRASALAPLVIIASALLAYHNSLDTPFLFDDFETIAANPSIRRLWPPGSALSPPASIGTGGRPLANLSFALDYALSGTAVRGYHLTNLALHALAGLTLYGLIRQTLACVPCRASSAAAGRLSWPPEMLALAVALLWVLHPVQTASVTYISQRTELLMALCYLATLYGFNRAVGGGSRRWQIASLVACAAGMACKESMVTAPVIVWLYDRTFFAGTFAAAWRQRRAYFLALASTWLLLGALLTTGLHERHLGFGLGVSPWTYALTEGQALFTYLRLGFWPHPLVFDYGPIFLSGVSSAIPFAALAATLIALALFAVWRYPRAGFAAAAFFLILAPTSSFVPVALQPIAENRMYLPLAALLTLGVVALRALPVRGTATLLLLVATAFTALTLRRNHDYQSSLTLWADTVAKRPANPRAHDNYAESLAAAGRTEAAIAHYRRALELNPSSPTSHAMLGQALKQMGRVAEAEQAYRRAIALAPERTPLRVALSAILIAGGKFQPAISELQATLPAGDTSPYVHQNLGFAYAGLGDPVSAERHLRRSLTLENNNASAHCSYANLLSARGAWREAAQHYREAVRLDPQSAMLHVALAQALAELGDLTAAFDLCQTALRLQPNLSEAHNNLGGVLVKMGRLAEALPHFAEAVRLRPDSVEAARNLAAVRAALAAPPP